MVAWNTRCVRARSKTAEYRTSIDVSNHTVAAVDWSLPSDTLELKDEHSTDDR